MGWDFSVGLDHLSNQLDRALREVGATEHKTHGSVGQLFEAKAQNRIDDFIEVWYLAGSADDGDRNIGVILFDADAEAKIEHLHGEELVMNRRTGAPVSVYSLPVQVWGYKVIPSKASPGYYGCPLSYFDEVPADNKSEELWRLRVAGRKGAQR